MIKTSDLTKTCVFLKLTLSRLGDKRGVSSDDIEVDADKEFVKVRKVIFKTHSFDRIRSLDGEIRRYVRTECLPFEPGIHLVPLKMVESIDAQLSAYLKLRREYVDEFAEVLPGIIKEMPTNLRKLFKQEDYDKFDHVQDEFFMSWQYLTFSAPLELEEVSTDIFTNERNKWNQRLQQAYEEARFILRETLLKLVQSLREKLEPDMYGSPKRLNASTVNHLREFLSTVELKNVTNDRELQQFSDQARRLLEGVDIEELRHTDGLRARIGGELQIIEHALDSAVQTAPRRRLRVA